MSRLKHAEPILQAAEQWKQRCLLDGGSVFSKEQLWTLDNFETLNRFYVERLDEGEGRFEVKLKRQLNPAPPGAKRLWAEMTWVYLLFPLNMTTERKRDRIATFWGGPARICWMTTTRYLIRSSTASVVEERPISRTCGASFAFSSR